MASSQPTVYSSIDSRKGEFRVIWIQAGIFDDPISCQLQTLNIHDEPHYDALSYVWGDPNDRESISVDGHTFEVTINLFEALKHLRSEQRSRCLWADAICINQLDIKERCDQVLLMGQIYRSASQVVSWLGLPAIDKMKGALRLLDRAAKRDYNPKWLYSSYWTPDPDPKERIDMLDDLRDFLVCIGEWSDTNIIDYWNRIWIKQEVALANMLTLQSGHFSIPESAIRQVALAFQDNRLDLSEFTPLRSYMFDPDMFDQFALIERPFSQMLATIEGVATGRILGRDPRRFEPLLYHLWQSRDKIYALLGLSSELQGPNGWSNLVPDYSTDLHQVYTDVTTLLIKSSGSLNILILCCPWNNSVEELPSWVPDWTSGYESSDRPLVWRFPWSNTSEPVPLHNREKVTSATPDTWPELTIYQLGSATALKALGFRVGTVGAHGPRFSKWEGAGDVYRNCHDVLKSMEPQLGQSIDPFKTDIVSNMSWPRENGSRLTYLETMYLLFGSMGSWYSDDLSDRTALFANYGERLGEICEGQVLFHIWRTKPEDQNPTPGKIPFGIGPPCLAAGDIVVLILGCDLPILLRPSDRRYKLIGAAYIECFMDGSAMVDLEAGLYSREMFELI
jgi:hypothetical protein